MKRFLCALMALVMVLGLCGCNIAKRISPNRASSSADLLNDATERMYVYMLAKLREFGDFTPVFYRYDYDCDGTADWMIRYPGDPHDFWILLPGGHMDTHIQLLFNWGTGTLEMSYSNADKRIYVTNEFKDSVTTFCFDGQAHDYCASVSRDYEFGDSGLTYFNCNYLVEGNTATEEEYTSYLRQLELIPVVQLDGIGYDELMPDVPQDMLPALAENISQFPFVTSVVSGDSDSDGIEDYLFYIGYETTSDDVTCPAGTTVTAYECGNVGRSSNIWSWSESTVFSLSSGTGSMLSSLTPYEAEALAFKASVSTVDGAQELVDAIVDTWTDADTGQLLTFGDDGIYSGKLAQLGTWRPTAANEITLGDGTVYTVSLSHGDGTELDILTLTSDSRTRRLFRGEYLNYKVTLIGTWESDDGQTRITLYDDDTYYAEQSGFPSKGSWYFDNESVTLVPADGDGGFIGQPWQLGYRETMMYGYYNDGSNLYLQKTS